MDTKFVIFVFISTFLIAAIYSSSVSVFAKEPHCVTSPDGKTKFCYVGADNPDDPITTVLCTKTSSGWNCKNYARSMDTKIPPALNDAIDAAIQESQNTT